MTSESLIASAGQLSKRCGLGLAQPKASPHRCTRRLRESIRAHAEADRFGNANTAGSFADEDSTVRPRNRLPKACQDRLSIMNSGGGFDSRLPGLRRGRNKDKKDQRANHVLSTNGSRPRRGGAPLNVASTRPRNKPRGPISPRRRLGPAFPTLPVDRPSTDSECRSRRGSWPSLRATRRG